MSQQPRGIRNHNPGNLRRSGDKWQGLSVNQTDPAFFVFDSPLWGIRALAITLISYQDKHDRNTIRDIIDRYAPPVENNTDSYVSAVASACGVGPDREIRVRQLLPCLVRAIIKHENGQQPYGDDVIGQAVEMALKVKPGV